MGSWPLRGLLGGHFLSCRWFLGIRWSESLLCLGQRIDFVLARDSCVGGENETESEAGQLLVLQPIHD